MNLKLRRIGVQTWLLRSALAFVAVLLFLPASVGAQSQNQSQGPSRNSDAPTDAAANATSQLTLPTDAGTETPDDRQEAAAVPAPDPFSLAAAPSAVFASAVSSSVPAVVSPSINYALANGADRCDLLSASGLEACLDNVLHDQRGVWTAPLHLHRRDAVWLVPLAGVTAAAFAFDNQALAAASSKVTPVRVANDFSDFGSAYTIGGAAVGIYVIGHFTHNEHVRETGMVALEALADAGILSEGLKLTTNRFRPDHASGSGFFWPDGTSKTGGETELYTINGSFPSGHTLATWAMVHVLVDETPGHRWLHVGLYALGTGIGFARVVGRDHYPSDVIVGGALGYLLGGYVYRQRSQFYQKGPLKAVSFSPVLDAGTRTYGMGVSFVP
jgi:membrane-associated phospholipid phosphatase